MAQSCLVTHLLVEHVIDVDSEVGGGGALIGGGIVSNPVVQVPLILAAVRLGGFQHDVRITAVQREVVSVQLLFLRHEFLHAPDLDAGRGAGAVELVLRARGALAQRLVAVGADGSEVGQLPLVVAVGGGGHGRQDLGRVDGCWRGARCCGVRIAAGVQLGVQGERLPAEAEHDDEGGVVTCRRTAGKQTASGGGGGGGA
ncbi:Severin [Gracilaria domingensis]|nr:Severin [Gracilaria domingensis]